MLVKSHPVKSGAQFRRPPQEGVGPPPALPSDYGPADTRRRQEGSLYERLIQAAWPFPLVLSNQLPQSGAVMY